MFRRIKYDLFISGIISVVILSYVPVAHASINSCSADVFQHNVSQGSSTDFQFQITNTDTDPFNWVKIYRPSDSFTVLSANISGWNGDSNSESATFTSGSLDPGASTTEATITAAASSPGSADWVIQVSDDPGGANPYSCTGNLNTTISAQGPSISNINVSNISDSGVTVSWDTDSPSTSQVNFGKTSLYGSSTTYDSSLKTTHSVNISGLQANTGYHYQIISTFPGGGVTTSDDSTFLTAIQSSQVIVANKAPSSGIPLLAVPIEKVPPTISVSTKLPKVLKTPVVMTGTASDNEALATVEYSTDGGENWLPADSVAGLGGKTASFSFTPQNLDDGDYVILTRAVDTSGNIGYSDKQTLVIDRLPPQVGGNVVSVGAQTLVPRPDGVVTSLSGVDENITTSAIGGANSVVINAERLNKNKAKLSKSFSLTQAKSSGLWSGIMSFSEEGAYVLTAQSVDGAGNKTSRVLNTVYVYDSPRLLNAGDKKPITNAKVTLYYLEPSSGAWTVWDGRAYGQVNSQQSNEQGKYKLFVPPGKYYLKAEAANHRVLLTNIFEVKQSSPILSTLYMKEAFGIKLGPVNIHIPPFSNDRIDFKVDEASVPLNDKSAVEIGKNIPDFTLSDNSGQQVHSTNFSGKPTVVSFISSWSPAAKDQLPSLSRLQKNKDINTIPIAIQERAGLLTAQSQISGSPLSFLQDPDGITVQKFNINSLPTHYFLDRHGVVKKVIIGTLTSEEIVKTLADM